MSEVEASMRDSKVASCFPSSDLLVRVFPMWDGSLAAKDSFNGLVFLNQFIAILSTWPVLRAGEFRNVTVTLGDDDDDENPAHQESVEKRAFSFYCQTFFNYFARAPTIPRPIPRVFRK